MKIHKLLLYSSQGRAQEESSKHLRLSSPVDKDITKIMAEAEAIQTETKKRAHYFINAAFHTLDVSFVVKQLTVLLVKILRSILG